MDRLTPEARSANMKAVRRKDTAPEMIVRRLLHAAGYRYRLHVKKLPGSPDIVFPGRKKAIFVHGCFWHGHDCRAGRRPQSRQDYWVPKIARNRERDAASVDALSRSGWTSLTVWECRVTDRDSLTEQLVDFLGPAGSVIDGKERG
ncbi:very short patch repair endonuclease [Xanthobacter autotrophicus]|uniref:very short patch repair endonuclease n=1 Tax=Xanthobacter autotrophicus TaxID=280 RepID=UPI0024A624A8|nr:very short patch repair endonuclease [Xanthobacter autotrophicus]MDI4655566.1 very short patch repair endonuclease [Xanthobacter autotrophicus]